MADKWFYPLQEKVKEQLNEMFSQVICTNQLINNGEVVEFFQVRSQKMKYQEVKGGIEVDVPSEKPPTIKNIMVDMRKGKSTVIYELEVISVID